MAVLNGTQTEGVQGVPELASRVKQDVVGPLAHFEPGVVTNTQSSFPETTVMYAPGHEEQASTLAAAVAPTLGTTPVGAMTIEVTDLADGAPVALVLGLDDAQFGA